MYGIRAAVRLRILTQAAATGLETMGRFGVACRLADGM
jgi:hypothetical protein